MERPEDVHVSRQDGEGLIERLHRDALTAQERRVLEQVLRWDFWLRCAVQEARLSLKRLRALLLGAQSKTRQEPPSDPSSPSSDGNGGAGAVGGSHPQRPSAPEAAGTGRPGHGRWGAQAYSGAARVACRHEGLAAGARGPACGRGRVYRIAPGVDIS